MKRYALLKLEHGANKVIFDCHAPDLKGAIEIFNGSLKNLQLDVNGYAKLGLVSYCVAEYWEPFHTLP